MPQVIDFTRKLRSIILFNGAPIPNSMIWGGIRYTVPARDDVNAEHSAKFPDGTWMPGTYIITDRYNADGIELEVNAPEVVSNLLGLTPKGNGWEATSPNARAGIAYMPAEVDKDSYQAIREGAIKQWEQFRVEMAREGASAYEEKCLNWRKAGLQAPPPSKHEEEDIAVLEAARKRAATRLDSIKVETGSSDDDLEFLAYAKKEAMNLAEAVNEDKTVDSAALAERLLADPKIRIKLQKKFRIRKVGYADDTEDSLKAEIAQAGK